MEKYDLMLEGKVIIVKKLLFYHGKLDHAWNAGRPCLVIYSDDEFEYILPITHAIKDKYLNDYEYINNDSFLVVYDKRFRENVLNKRKKLSNKNENKTSGYINLRHVYKIPVAFRSEIGKIKYDCYKKIIKKLKNHHHTNTLEEIIKKAVIK